ncbi:MAG TPA: SHOCT domain-containing protein [Solirubrobacteraceae bacterium]|nr:SHOCT domain-containing protein [Solirubrobacteraceae bacterium]
MARTAVVAGTATAVSNRVSRRQGERWQRQYEEEAPQQAAPPAPAPVAAAPAVDPIEQLKQLAELKQQGILTDDEFAVQKARILGTA